MHRCKIVKPAANAIACVEIRGTIPLVVTHRQVPTVTLKMAYVHQGDPKNPDDVSLLGNCEVGLFAPEIFHQATIEAFQGFIEKAEADWAAFSLGGEGQLTLTLGDKPAKDKTSDASESTPYTGIGEE